MKKIGIVTIIDYNNYGNRLQNYAMQEVIKQLGCEPTTILNVAKKPLLKAKEPMITRLLSGNAFKKIIRKIASKLNEKQRTRVFNEKIRRLRAFSTQYMNESMDVIGESDIPKTLEQTYDYFVVGSDQVWNPMFRHGSSIDFLTFAPKAKRVAYAPSFGISYIPETFVPQYKTWLSDFHRISVREHAGAEIVKQLTGRDVDVLPDPTLLVSKDHWLQMAKPSLQKPKDGYILTYFLGKQSKEVKQIIKDLCEKQDLRVVHLGSYEQMNQYATDPSEFIDYVNSAHIFLTDSFHGTVFSILFQKPFIVFERKSHIPSMGSRIDTLLITYKLENSKWLEGQPLEAYLKVTFDHVNEILVSERKRAFDYLSEALNLQKD